MINSQEWVSYRLLICGWCRHEPFLAWKKKGVSFQDFFQHLADHKEVPMDGTFLHGTVLASVMPISDDDGFFLQDHNLVTFVSE